MLVKQIQPAYDCHYEKMMEPDKASSQVTHWVVPYLVRENSYISKTQVYQDLKYPCKILPASLE